MSDPVARLNASLEGRYRVERELGEGGMANVYLASDLRHDRKVALKVLKPELAAVVGSERFLAEIKTTANLQHPNILPLFDSGAADEFLFYVMPYVEGESLREKLDREHQLPVDAAVQIATDVAEALDYAHDHGVIHRDIKPANILLQAGKPVVSDFGIALAVGAAGKGRLTETGLSVGTPHYMSPEQATGDPNVGAATDIYAVGCVLYEMLVGEPPYTGATPQAVLGKILAGELSSATKQRSSVPANVDAAIRKALENVPADRFVSGQALARALTDTSFGTRPALGRSAVARGDPPLWSRAIPWVVAAALAGLLLATGTRSPAPVPTVYDVGLPDEAQMSFTGGSADGLGWPAFALSAEGDFVVYVADREGSTELWYRSLLDAEAHPIEGTDGAYSPMLSPDGASVAFFATGQVWRIPIEGGEPVRLMDVEPFSSSGHWVSMDRIVVHDDVVGRHTRVIDPTTRAIGNERDRTGACLLPFVLSNDDVLCNNLPPYAMRVLQRDSATTQDLMSGGQTVFGSNLKFVDGYVTFVTAEGALQIATFHGETLEIGRPATVLSGLRREGSTGAAHYAVTAAGSLIYVPGRNAEVGRMVRVSRDGVRDELPIAPAPFLTFDLSPDGERFAAVTVAIGGVELWVFDLQTGGSTRWISAPGMIAPRWSHDGDELAVLSDLGADERAILLGDPRQGPPTDTIRRGTGASPRTPSDFYADDRLLVTGGDVVEVLDLSRAPPDVVRRIERVEFGASVSPDGRWVAHSPPSDRSGRLDVVIEGFEEDRPRETLTPDGGQEAVWLSNTELAFRLGRSWYTVSVDDAIPNPQLWFTDDRFQDTAGLSHTSSEDGGVVYVQAAGRSTGSYLRVIPNWLEGAKAAADAADQR